MIWAFVFIVFGIVLAVSIADDCCYSTVAKVLLDIALIPIFGVFGFFLGVLFCMLIGFIGAFTVPTNEVVISETDIYSLTDTAEYEGRFVLGSGQVDGDLKIYYVTESDGGKKIERADRDKVVIVESDERPHAVVMGDRYKWKWVNLFALDIHELLGDRVTLTVPKDTVTTEYSIDLK